MLETLRATLYEMKPFPGLLTRSLQRTNKVLSGSFAMYECTPRFAHLHMSQMFWVECLYIEAPTCSMVRLHNQKWQQLHISVWKLKASIWTILMVSNVWDMLVAVCVETVFSFFLPIQHSLTNIFIFCRIVSAQERGDTVRQLCFTCHQPSAV